MCYSGAASVHLENEIVFGTGGVVAEYWNAPKCRVRDDRARCRTPASSASTQIFVKAAFVHYKYRSLISL